MRIAESDSYIPGPSNCKPMINQAPPVNQNKLANLKTGEVIDPVLDSGKNGQFPHYQASSKTEPDCPKNVAGTIPPWGPAYPAKPEDLAKVACVSYQIFASPLQSLTITPVGGGASVQLASNDQKSLWMAVNLRLGVEYEMKASAESNRSCSGRLTPKGTPDKPEIEKITGNCGIAPAPGGGKCNIGL